MQVAPGVFSDNIKERMAKKRRISIKRVFIAFGGLLVFIGLIMAILLLTAAKPPVYAITICQNEISWHPLSQSYGAILPISLS